MNVCLSMRFACQHVCLWLKIVAPMCRTLLVMAALALVWWLGLSLLCGTRTLGCTLDCFGKLEFLGKCCTLKHMQLASLQLELVVTLMILVGSLSSLVLCGTGFENWLQLFVVIQDSHSELTQKQINVLHLD